MYILGYILKQLKHSFQYLVTMEVVRKPLLKGLFVKLTWGG